MNETPAWLLLFGVVFLLLLFIGLFAAVIAYVGRSRPNRSVPSPAEQSSPQRDRPSLAPVQEESPAPPPAVEMPARPGEVMRVIRDDRTGQVLIEVDGKRYAHIREITDAQVGRRVLWAISDLVRFTGGMATNPQAVRSIVGAGPKGDTPSTSTTPSSPVGSTVQALVEEVNEVRVTSTSPRRPVPRSRPSSASTRTPGTTTPDIQSDRQRYSLADYFRRGFEAPEPREPLPSATAFIDDIEEILQDYIRDLPAPLPYDVHVVSSENGVLEIRIGLNTYGSPDEVPDPQIRHLIRSAVAEWEKR
jgi:hypothetical protein